MIVNTTCRFTDNTKYNQQFVFKHVCNLLHACNELFSFYLLSAFLQCFHLVATSLVAHVTVVFLVRHVVYEALVLCRQDRMACVALVCLLGITKLGFCLL